MCGEDTVPGQDIVSDDADILSRIARDEAAKCDAYARFELYFDERGQDHAG
jgi:hypothetical protein